jgi:protein phosphatase
LRAAVYHRGPVPPAVEFAQKTDPGRDPDKQVNEDACEHLETRLGHLCVVCDGMGGHVGGREASTLAVKTILDRVAAAGDGESPRDALRAAIEEANKQVHQMSKAKPGIGHPGSTVVAILLHEGGTEVAHVGDSRCYLVHQGQIVQVTRDHSMVQELVDQGVLTREQAERHPEANKITRALGMDVTVEVEVREAPVPHVAGDVFVLCSDGLCDLVKPEDILGFVTSAPPAQAAPQLVDLANARGGFDNISVQLLHARESAKSVKEGPAPTVVQPAGGRADSTPALPSVGSRAGSTAALPSVGRRADNPPALPASGPVAPTLADMASGLKSVPPTSSMPPGARGGPPAAVIVGALIAIAGVVVAVAALYLHLHARRAAPKVAPEIASEALWFDAGAPKPADSTRIPPIHTWSDTP